MRTTLTALGVVAVIGAAGCSSDGSAKHADTRKTRSSVTSQASSPSTTQPFVANTKNTPGTLADFVGAKADVHDTTCNHDGGSWNANGTVTNPTKSVVRYRIYVSFLSGDTTVGLAEANVAKVGPKQSVKWEQSVKVSSDNLRCILRVERADI